MAEYREVTKIESLNGSNYQSWKYNMKLVLMDRGLWGYVTGDEIAPVAAETDTKDKEIKEFRLKSEKAYSLIALNVQKDIQIHIANTTSPETAWKTLEAQFQFVSITEIVRLSRSFYAATMEEGSDLMVHITKMTTLAQRLRELKEDISSKKFATTILGSLPDSYNVFLSSLNARDATKMDWDEIRPLLIEEFIKCKEKNIKAKSHEDALFVGRPHGNSNIPGGSSYYNNYYSKQNVHDGRSQDGGRGRGIKRGGGSGGYHDNYQGNNKGYRPLCFKCDEPGHKVRFCPKNRKEEGYFVSSQISVINENGGGRDLKRRKLNERRNDDVEVSVSDERRNDDVEVSVSDKVSISNVVLNSAVALTSSSDINKNSREWFIDSAASSHMVHDVNTLVDYIKYDDSFGGTKNVFLGDNTLISVEGEGKVHLFTSDENGGETCLLLDKVLHVPQLAKNLLSVPALTQTGTKILFDKENCHIIRDNEKYLIGCVNKDGKLYKVNPRVENNEFANAVEEEYSSELWHLRFGHLNYKYIKDLEKHNMVSGLKITENTFTNRNDCETCIFGKMNRKSCPKSSETRASNCYELIHTDLCGPLQVSSIGGSRYILTFTDDYSRYVHVYMLKRKSEVLQRFKEFCNLVVNRTGRQIKKLNIWKSVQALRSDNGGEYVSNDFISYCAEKGIIHQFTNPYTPEQNGISERLNRTIIESVRSMLIQSKLPLSFWAEAVAAAVYTHNRSPTSALNNVTPYELWFGKRPNISNLRVFGCICYYHVPKELRRKLDPKSRKAIFVGYVDGVKGYKVFDIETNKFCISNVIRFSEMNYHEFEDGVVSNNWSSKKYTLFPDIHDIYDESTLNDKPSDDAVVEVTNTVPVINKDLTGDTQEEESAEPVGVIPPTYEERYMEEVSKLGPVRNRKPSLKLIEECANIAHEVCLLTSLTDVDEPSSYNEALDSPYSDKWKEAMESEHGSLLRNDTWDLVERPEGVNVVGSRWVYKVKRNAEGEIDRFKARLVAQGYTQTHGIDYGEVFSPVARTPAIRSILAVANALNLEVHQMDVCTAFLNGELDCVVYMEQPQGFVSLENKNLVCKLKKGIYGLKQAARCWNETIDDFLQSRGYSKSDADDCVYVKTVGDKFIIILLYVDDLIPVSNDIQLLDAEKSALCKQFDMVDNGEVSFILGLNVKREREINVLTISQSRYLQDILKRFRMEDCNPVATPLETGRTFRKIDDTDVPFDPTIYQQAIGCLTYASVCSRPDISASVGMLSQFMSCPSTDHWSGVKRILRYIKGTLNYGLKFSGNGISLKGYSDADWAGDLDTRRSTSGYIFQIGDSTVSWSSKRQTTVAKSSTEAEYVALSYATQEAVWLRKLLHSVGMISLDDPTTIYEDNIGAIELSRNAKFHNRTKHIDIAHHFVRERVKTKTIDVTHCPSKEMIADILTKGIPKFQFEKLRDLLGVTDIL